MIKDEKIQKNGNSAIDFDNDVDLIDEESTIKKIGNITIQEEIGRGAFAIVYKG